MIVATLVNYIFAVPDVAILEPLWYATAATTIFSGIGYLDGSGLRKLRKET
jgi:hypothetical protein